MNVEPAIIYSAFGVIAAVVLALWGVVLKDHTNCQRNVRLLTEHCIAQQQDIKALMVDRVHRNLPKLDLHSEKTEFFQEHMGGDL